MNLDLLGLSFWDSLAIAGLVLLPLVSFYVPRSQRSREERLETSTRLFFIYLAALVIWKSQELPTGLDGPRTLPLVFSGLLMVSAFLLYFVKEGSVPSREEDMKDSSYTNHSFLLLLIIFCYLLAIPYLGYLLSSAISAIALSYLCGNRRIKSLLLLSTLWCCFSYGVFEKFLNISLP